METATTRAQTLERDAFSHTAELKNAAIQIMALKKAATVAEDANLRTLEELHATRAELEDARAAARALGDELATLRAASDADAVDAEEIAELRAARDASSAAAEKAAGLMTEAASKLRVTNAKAEELVREIRAKDMQLEKTRGKLKAAREVAGANAELASEAAEKLRRADAEIEALKLAAAAASLGAAIGVMKSMSAEGVFVL